MPQRVSSAPETPLCKQNAGVRPISISKTLRSPVSKLWSQRTKGKTRSYLGDSQAGVAAPGGTATAVHAVKCAATHLRNDMNNMAVLQIDLANASNRVSHRAFLRIVRTRFLELYPLVRYTYVVNSPWLWYELIRWRSATGVQQGDQMGPLLLDDSEPDL